MTPSYELPLPVLDALPLGAHRLMALTDEALAEVCGVRIAFFGRDGGTSTGQYASLNCSPSIGDDVHSVERNHALVCEAVGAPGVKPVVPFQVHGTDIVAVTEDACLDDARERAREGADGLLVEQSGVVALLNSADCPIVAVVSPTGRFAVVHAGWRGAVAGIAGKAVCELSRRCDHDPSLCNAYISPHIRSECFQVGEDVAQRFADRFGSECIAEERHVSLARAIGIDLIRNGMDAARIADAGICTKCNPGRYYSYRASEGKCGRQATVVMHVQSG